jgi:hypothetical protein
MSYDHVNVTLTRSQVKKLQSKKSTGTNIKLKHKQMMGGPNKLSLTKTQHGEFIKSKNAGVGIKLVFSQSAIDDMIKSGGFFPLLIPALAAIATGALSGVAGWGTKKVLYKATGSGYVKKGKGFRLPGSRLTKHYQ